MHGGLHAPCEGLSFNEGQREGQRSHAFGPQVLGQHSCSIMFGESPCRVKVFDPRVNNLSLKLGKEPGQWQALAGLTGRRTGQV